MLHFNFIQYITPVILVSRLNSQAPRGPAIYTAVWSWSESTSVFWFWSVNLVAFFHDMVGWYVGWGNKGWYSIQQRLWWKSTRYMYKALTYHNSSLWLTRTKPQWIQLMWFQWWGSNSMLESSFSNIPIYPLKEYARSEWKCSTPEAAGVSESELFLTPVLGNKKHANTTRNWNKLPTVWCPLANSLFYLTAHDVLTARRTFCSLGRSEQRQWLANRLHENSCEEEKGKVITSSTVAGCNICQLS